jgi:polysaccharide export outer membrane protein
MKTTICLAALALLSVGCNTGDYFWPDEAMLREFEAAGPIKPEFDGSQLPKASLRRGPYVVVQSDVLSIGGFGAALPEGYPSPLSVRVADDGTIPLARLGQVEVAGLTLAQIEKKLTEAVYPKYVKYPPTILVQVAEPRTRRVSVLGNVNAPGYHDLTADNLSLVGALTAAGGIMNSADTTSGARQIRISRAGEDAGEPQALLLPVRGLNIPFVDVPLEGGETIEVERWDPAIFTVIGLVGGAGGGGGGGAFEYPRDTEYNLLQALAMAGGPDPIAGPPYATIYRKKASGEVLAVSFEIRGSEWRQAEVVIKPGDIISVQPTMGTWTREAAAQAIRLQANIFYSPFGVNGQGN